MTCISTINHKFTSYAKLGKFLLIFEVQSYDSPLSLAYEYDEFCNKLNL